MTTSRKQALGTARTPRGRAPLADLPAGVEAPAPLFFPTPASFRAWLAANHDSETELWVGFHKKATGRPSITWEESVREALCYGWIDGVRKSVDQDSYKIRFTPRKPRSAWSAINLRLVEELTAGGLMTPAGRAVYEARDSSRADHGYSIARRPEVELSPAHAKRFRADRAAWEFFQAQAPSYRKMALHWVTSAKKEETREARLEKLIAASKAGRRL
jgi:uncharacterized protein YdeI (YjbR/CyaY-like superfamily)